MKIGSLVECIEDIEDRYYYEVVPVRGGIYTVREFYDHESIRLEEIVNKPMQYSDGFGEVAWYVFKFRELQPPMDISELIEECQTQTISK